jgi:hypothetical protein
VVVAWACIGLLDVPGKELTAQDGRGQVVDTGQERCFDSLAEIACPSPGSPFFGQDAQHEGVEPDYTSNGDGTVTDVTTGLMWSRGDSGDGMDWQDALAWVQEKNAEGYLGHDDWRLPNAKELQGLVDYARSPDATGSAAIDPVFATTEIVNEAGQRDYPAFWTSTTHVNTSTTPGGYAVYISFGRAMLPDPARIAFPGWLSRGLRQPAPSGTAPNLVDNLIQPLKKA